MSRGVRVRLLAVNRSHRGDHLRMYEQVLREGTDGDVHFYVGPVESPAPWDELVLTSPVRRAWADWIRGHRSAA